MSMKNTSRMTRSHAVKKYLLPKVKQEQKPIIRFTSLKCFCDSDILSQFAEAAEINAQGFNMKSYCSRKK